MAVIYNTPLFTTNVPPITPPNTVNGPGFSVDASGNILASSISVSGNGAIGGLLTASGGLSEAGNVGVFSVAPTAQQANASSAAVNGIVAGAAYAQADMAAVKTALLAIRAGLAANGYLANTT